MKATLEMALEALTNPSTIAVQHAIELIKAELAKPEQEPVRWFQQLGDAPPRKPWQGLTEEEIDWILDLAYADDMELIKTIEAKLKEKNCEN